MARWLRFRPSEAASLPVSSALPSYPCVPCFAGTVPAPVKVNDKASLAEGEEDNDAWGRLPPCENVFALSTEAKLSAVSVVMCSIASYFAFFELES